MIHQKQDILILEVRNTLKIKYCMLSFSSHISLSHVSDPQISRSTNVLYVTSVIFPLTELWLTQSCFFMMDLMITFWHTLSSRLPEKK